MSLIVLCLLCVGCWQEIRYEADAYGKTNQNQPASEEPNQFESKETSSSGSRPEDSQSKETSKETEFSTIPPNETLPTPEAVDIVPTPLTPKPTSDAPAIETTAVKTSTDDWLFGSNKPKASEPQNTNPVAEAPKTSEKKSQAELPTEPELAVEVANPTAADPFGEEEGSSSSTKKSTLEETTEPKIEKSLDPFGDEKKTVEESTEPIIDLPAVTPEAPPSPTNTLPSTDSPDEKQAPEPPALPISTPTELATWQMSSKWSIAVALQAKNVPEARYKERLEQATYAAKLLNVKIPELPVYPANAERLSANINFLLTDAGPRLAAELSKQHDAKHAALAELAINTHVLLLCYTPTSTRLEPIIASIQQAAKTSALPESVWRELVDLLVAKADFKQVKQAIYRLHKQAPAVLSGQSLGASGR